MASRSKNQGGFTILEVLIAVIMIAIVATFSLPSLAKGLRAHQLASATRAATNYIRVVRATAVARHTPARLVVTSGNRLGVEVLDGSWTRLPTGIVLDGSVVVAAVNPGDGIVFGSDGTASAAGTVRLRNALGDERVISISILGSVAAS
jgi:prepilin-type N-terminal cleavage/methylation domain-containing protein